MFKNEIDLPGSVQRAKQIFVEKEAQNQADRNAKNPGKLHGKALPGFSLFAQCRGEYLRLLQQRPRYLCKEIFESLLLDIIILYPVALLMRDRKKERQTFCLPFRNDF